ncbi:MAG: hypothetical protein EOP84_14700 [Verrucomicrobiaceae bacterium]|nr:MAG: hypothetical protein EOP84_14700 [Verrucomicrobiaceae bacterium]
MASTSKSAKAKTKGARARSLAWVKFRQRLELESRLYWNVACSVAYARRWLESLPEDKQPKFLADYPGDKQDPFLRINIRPSEFIAIEPHALAMITENAIVSFVTTFEVYLFEVAQRAIFIQPDLINNSENQPSNKSTLEFKASELSVAAMQGDFRSWFSRAVANKYIRGKTHAEMIGRLNGMIKLGVNKDNPRVQAWRKWELLRNAIVHTARTVSEDLMREWGDRFSVVGARLNLTSRDVIEVTKLAADLIDAMDIRFRGEVVKSADDELLIRELFVKFGIEDSGQLRNRVSSITRSVVSRSEIDRVIGKQKRDGAPIVGYDFAGLLDFD